MRALALLQCSMILAACGVGTGGGADLGADDTSCPLPPPAGAARNVSFHVTNASPFDVFLVENAGVCDAFALTVVDDAGAVAVPLAPGWTCGCSCAGPPPFTATLRQLHPNDAATLAWDGRGFFGCTETVACPPGNMPSSYDALTGTPAALAAGTYHVTVGGWSSPPAGCAPTGTGEWTCTSACSDVSCAYTPSQPQSLCASQATGGATFVLPDGGDVTVEVSIQ